MKASTTQPGWMALAARAQGYKSQALLQELLVANQAKERAARIADEHRQEAWSVLSAWQRLRANNGADPQIEDRYRAYHAHVHACSEVSGRRHLDAISAADSSTSALRHSFSQQRALHALEQRGEAEMKADLRRSEFQAISEAWALRRSEGSEGKA